jgi:hypothetical protein
MLLFCRLSVGRSVEKEKLLYTVEMKNKLLIGFVSAVLIAMGITGAWLVSNDLQNQQYSAQAPLPLPAEQTEGTSPNLLGATTEVPSLGQQTKTSNCQGQDALPDFACTPGAVFPTVTKDDICTSGYSQKVRDVSQKTKDRVYAMYGVTTHTTGQYEVDHLISLELGGSNEVSNLWPEPAEPTPGFHEKDKVENYLHSQVCAGVISLSQAQKIIATDWQSVYEQLGQLKNQ